MEEISVGDSRYPRLLAVVRGCPKVLCVKGNIEVLQERMVAVVGSRQRSKMGEERCRLVVQGLVEMGKVVVSGLARGIDRVAHEAALANGGKTVAVLAHGLDMIYPSEHKELAEKIIQGGGALVSELGLGVRPLPSYFLERNRIVVGVSECLVVVEAMINSGSMASANHAAEMGREVLAIPGSPGTDLLIKEGAIRIEL